MVPAADSVYLEGSDACTVACNVPLHDRDSSLLQVMCDVDLPTVTEASSFSVDRTATMPDSLPGSGLGLGHGLVLLQSLRLEIAGPSSNRIFFGLHN